MKLIYILIAAITLSAAAHADCGIKQSNNWKDAALEMDYVTCSMEELNIAERHLVLEMARVRTLRNSVTSNGNTVDNSLEMITPYKASLALVRIQKLYLLNTSLVK